MSLLEAKLKSSSELEPWQAIVSRFTIIGSNDLCLQIIPVRCFSCGKVVGDKWNQYLEYLAKDMSEGCAVDYLSRSFYDLRKR